MKRKLLSIIALLCLTVSGAWADETWTSGDCTVTFSNGVLTVSKTSGSGAMADYSGESYQPWKDVRYYITSVVIEEGVTSIGNNAFSNIFFLGSVTIPASVTTIGNNAFYGCNNLTSISIPASVTSIGNYAFSNCAKLATVTIPASVTSIGDHAFYGCAELATVTIPASVTSIGDYAFSTSGSNATALTVTFAPESSLTTIGECAFSNANLTSITIPASVTSIGTSAFSNCTKLASVSILASVTPFEFYIFSGCTNLTSITFNSNQFFALGPSLANEKLTVTMNLTANDVDGTYWTTFCNNKYNFQADANTQVFKVELNQTNGELTIHEIEDRIVNVGTAVVLKSTGNPVMTLTSSTSSDGQTNNLNGVTTLAGVTAAEPSTTYVLNNKSAGVGFYKLKSENTIGYGKAYLTYSGGNAREFFLFDEATGIEAIDNGQWIMDNEAGVVYDLQGRRVAQPAKGLYIVNGKKVIIK